MSRVYERWRRVACRLASSRTVGAYAAAAVRFGARLEELCERGDLTPAQRDSLWKLVDPYPGTIPIPDDSIDFEPPSPSTSKSPPPPPASRPTRTLRGWFRTPTGASR